MSASPVHVPWILGSTNVTKGNGHIRAAGAAILCEQSSERIMFDDVVNIRRMRAAVLVRTVVHEFCTRAAPTLWAIHGR